MYSTLHWTGRSNNGHVGQSWHISTVLCHCFGGQGRWAPHLSSTLTRAWSATPNIEYSPAGPGHRWSAIGIRDRLLFPWFDRICLLETCATLGKPLRLLSRDSSARSSRRDTSREASLIRVQEPAGRVGISPSSKHHQVP